MLAKYFSTAALLLTTVLSKPLHLTIDITEDSLSHSVKSAHVFDDAVKHHHKKAHGLVKDIEVSTKYSGYTYEMIGKVKKNKPSSMLTVIGGVYTQYKKIEESIGNLPEELSEKNATDTVNAFYDLTEAFKYEFDLVVEKKSTLQEHDVLSYLLHDMIVYFNNMYAEYNEGLFGLLPTDSLKEDFTDYSAGAALSIGSAMDALAPPSSTKLSVQEELK